MVIGFSLTLVASGILLIAERRVADAQARLGRQSALLESGVVIGPGPNATPLPLDSRPAALLADALFLARAAQFSHDTRQRKALLDRAATELAVIVNARPHWGEAWVMIAFVEALREGEDAPSARYALERSYAETPYLPHAVVWRVAYSLRHWNSFSATTQEKILNEDVWLMHSGRDAGVHKSMMILTRQSPAYRRYMIRWLQTRQGDADFRPVKGLTP